MQTIDTLVAQLRLLPESLIDENFLASDDAILSIWNHYHTASPKLLPDQVELIRTGGFTQFIDLCRMIYPLQLSHSYVYFLARYGGGFIKKHPTTANNCGHTIDLYGIGPLSEYMYTNILESEGLPPYIEGYLPMGDHSQVENTRLLLYCLKQQCIIEIPYTHDYMPVIKVFEQQQHDGILTVYSSFENFLKSLTE